MLIVYLFIIFNFALTFALAFGIFNDLSGRIGNVVFMHGDFRSSIHNYHMSLVSRIEVLETKLSKLESKRKKDEKDKDKKDKDKKDKDKKDKDKKDKDKKDKDKKVLSSSC